MNFQRGRGKEPLEINLPTAEAEKQLERANEITVLVSAQGQYVINRNPIPFRGVEQLAEELKRATGTLKAPLVVISADASATHQAVVRVMEASRLAGLTQLSFTTQSAR